MGHMMKAGAARLTKDAQAPAEVADGGSVTGYAATFDREPDCYGDVIARGAFARTLREWEARGEGVCIPLLYGHVTDDPEHNIGRVTSAVEDERGLLVTAEFDADNPKAQYARKLVREGRLYQFSFAYDVRDRGEVELGDGRKANELRDVDLFEVSLVQIPANQNAQVTEVKGAGPASHPRADGTTPDGLPIYTTGVVDVVPRAKGSNGRPPDDLADGGVVTPLTNAGSTIEDFAVRAIANEIVDVLKRGGAKAGRRNSKADEDRLHRILALADEMRDLAAELLGEDDPGDGGEEGPDGDDGATEGGEGGESPKGREVGAAVLEAYRGALLRAHADER